MSSQKPTILFFAGAFSEPACFDALATELQKSGYPTAYAHVLTLNPSDPSSVSTAQDAERARAKYLLPLLEENKDVIIFTHSYGGIVGGQAAYGLSKQDRAKAGKKGGVVGLVYLVGNIAGEGGSLIQAVGGAYPPFIKENFPSKGLAVIDPILDVLYNDLSPSTQLTSELQAAMIPHALAAFETPATAPAWAESAYDGRRVYIRTLEDQCNPSFLQDMWMEKTGVKWEVIDLKSGHCPFIGEKVGEVAGIFRDAVSGWA